MAALVAAAGIGYRDWRTASRTPKYRTATVERGSIAATVSATGNLNAVITVLVGSQVSGTVKELAADFNTMVRRGQVIARIDPALFETAVNQARADLEAARSTVLSQQAQVEQARTNLDNARAGYAEAKAQTRQGARGGRRRPTDAYAADRAVPSGPRGGGGSRQRPDHV
jgi:HlyD family secretion protein